MVIEDGCACSSWYGAVNFPTCDVPLATPTSGFWVGFSVLVLIINLVLLLPTGWTIRQLVRLKLFRCDVISVCITQLLLGTLCFLLSTLTWIPVVMMPGLATLPWGTLGEKTSSMALASKLLSGVAITVSSLSSATLGSFFVEISRNRDLGSSLVPNNVIHQGAGGRNVQIQEQVFLQQFQSAVLLFEAAFLLTMALLLGLSESSYIGYATLPFFLVISLAYLYGAVKSHWMYGRAVQLDKQALMAVLLDVRNTCLHLLLLLLLGMGITTAYSSVATKGWKEFGIVSGVNPVALFWQLSQLAVILVNVITVVFLFRFVRDTWRLRILYNDPHTAHVWKRLKRKQHRKAGGRERNHPKLTEFSSSDRPQPSSSLIAT